MRGIALQSVRAAMAATAATAPYPSPASWWRDLAGDVCKMNRGATVYKRNLWLALAARHGDCSVTRSCSSAAAAAGGHHQQPAATAAQQQQQQPQPQSEQPRGIWARHSVTSFSLDELPRHIASHGNSNGTASSGVLSEQLLSELFDAELQQRLQDAAARSATQQSTTAASAGLLAREPDAMPLQSEPQEPWAHQQQQQQQQLATPSATYEQPGVERVVPRAAGPGMLLPDLPARLAPNDPWAPPPSPAAARCVTLVVLCDSLPAWPRCCLLVCLAVLLFATTPSLPHPLLPQLHHCPTRCCHRSRLPHVLSQLLQAAGVTPTDAAAALTAAADTAAVQSAPHTSVSGRRAASRRAAAAAGAATHMTVLNRIREVQLRALLEDVQAPTFGPKPLLLQRLCLLLQEQQQQSQQHARQQQQQQQEQQQELFTDGQALAQQKDTWTATTSVGCARWAQGEPGFSSSATAAAVGDENMGAAKGSHTLQELPLLGSHPRSEEVAAAAAERATLLAQLLDPAQVGNWLLAAKAQDVYTIDVRCG
jgi:hypothetical protein